MRARLGVVVVVSLLLAGCAGTPGVEGDGYEISIVDTDREVETRGSDELWVTWLRGNETRTAVEGEPSHGVCDVAFSHRLDPANRTLTFDGERYPSLDPSETWGLLATDHWDEATFCPIAYGLHPDPADGVEIGLGQAGTVILALHEDGRLTVEERTVEQGQAARVTYTYESTEDGTVYRHEGSFTVEVLGAWPAEDVRPTETR